MIHADEHHTTAPVWRCGPARVLGLRVPALCAPPQPLDRDADLFAVLGLPRRLTIDRAELEQRYYAASRRVHPGSPPDGGRADAGAEPAASAAVNRAYRTLRDPVERGRYWLELHGESLGRDNERVPPALAALVFEVQEQLEELRARGGTDAATRCGPSHADARRACAALGCELRGALRRTGCGRLPRRAGGPARR